MISKSVPNSLRAMGRMFAVGFLFFVILVPSMARAGEPQARTLAEDERYQSNLRRWQAMTEEEREAVRHKAAAMSEEDRRLLKARMAQYRALPPAERLALREKYLRFRTLPPEQREALKRKFRRFLALPPERRKEILQRFLEKRAAPGPKSGQPGAMVRPKKGPQDLAGRNGLSEKEYREKVKERRKKQLEKKKKYKLRKKARRNHHKEDESGSTQP